MSGSGTFAAADAAPVATIHRRGGAGRLSTDLQWQRRPSAGAVRRHGHCCWRPAGASTARSRQNSRLLLGLECRHGTGNAVDEFPLSIQLPPPRLDLARPETTPVEIALPGVVLQRGIVRYIHIALRIASGHAIVGISSVICNRYRAGIRCASAYTQDGRAIAVSRSSIMAETAS